MKIKIKKASVVLTVCPAIVDLMYFPSANYILALAYKYRAFSLIIYVTAPV